MITVNGSKTPLTEPTSIAQLLEVQGFSADRVVVERNLKILPQKEYATTLLCDSDRIEILQFVGGG